MLLYFLRGSLPWQGLLAANRQQKEELILAKKEAISTKDLCEDLPAEFGAYFDHVRSRSFDDKPRYSFLRRLFRGLFIRQGFEYDFVFDWTILKYLTATQRRKSV